MIEETTQKITKHRSTLAPFECVHCGFMWYGWVFHNPSTLPGTVLCSPCWRGVDNIVYTFGDESIEAKRDTAAWIADKTKKPLPRPVAKRYHHSVPKWVRSAIDQGMIKTNGKECYIVYSCDQVAVRVEITDRSTLKPFRARG